MKYFLFVLLFFFLYGCCKDDDQSSPGDLPACLEELTEPGASMDTTLMTVRQMEVDGEFHFWLNTGDLAFDGPEYIVNSTCDTVCLFCFCPPQPCMEDYENGDWEIIWEK